MNPETSAPAPYIVVLGSLNMDLVVKVPHAPAAGETLHGHSIHHIPGGKGGNQATSCARQGARVSLIGCIGADADGEALRTALQDDGIDTDALRTDPAQPTGTAVVMVEDSGQNRIVVIAGANASLSLDEPALGAQLARADFLVTQFETPMPQVARAMQLARQAGCKVLLNPSPMQPFDTALWPLIDTLVVNEVEAGALAGRSVGTAREAAEAGAALRAHGVARVIVTLGGAGAVAIDADGARHHPAPQVQVVDTTAAGDTFLGAIAVALASDASLDEAVTLGIRAAALCVTRPGAQPSIPTREEVLRSPHPPAWDRAVKRTALLHAELSRVIATLGHGDMLVLGDAGLPIPDGPLRIDLAVTPGVPAIADVLKAVLSEMQVERVILAREALAREDGGALPAWCAGQLAAMPELVTHEELKQLTAGARAVVRTGECTSYANIVLCAGVTF